MDILGETLRELGLTKNYRSYRRTAVAISLAIEKEERMEAVTKEIYPTAARICGCSWVAVERSLRTSIDQAWRINRSFLVHMAGYPLECKPSAGQFIEIVAVYLLRKEREAGEAIRTAVSTLQIEENMV